MKAAFLAAKQEIEKFNASFDYVAGIGEIAADIWHNHATVAQRTEIMSCVVMAPGKSLQNLRSCYKVIEEMIV